MKVYRDTMLVQRLECGRSSRWIESGGDIIRRDYQLLERGSTRRYGLSLENSDREQLDAARGLQGRMDYMRRKSSSNPPTNELRNSIEAPVASNATRIIVVGTMPTSPKIPNATAAIRASVASH